MNDTALMIRLLGRLKKEMNGAVAEAMQRRGLNYPLNYGVSVPTIRSIAGEYGTSHSLAMLLYRQQVRELKLAAAFVDDPQQVTPDQMRLWADGFANTELVEQVVYNLFRKAPGAERVALEWLDSPKPLLRYAGLLTAASTVRPEMEQTMRQAFFDRIDQLVFREIDMCAGITLDTRRITDVAQYLMRKSLLQLLRCPLKSLYLATRKGIKLFGITSHQMREYGTRNNSRLLFQALYQLRYLIRCKAEPMHEIGRASCRERV